MSKIITSAVLAIIAYSIMSFCHDNNPNTPVMLVTFAAGMFGLFVG